MRKMTTMRKMTKMTTMRIIMTMIPFIWVENEEVLYEVDSVLGDVREVW